MVRNMDAQTLKEKQNIWNTWKVAGHLLLTWVDRTFSPDTLYLSTIGSTWFIIGWLLRSAYHLSYEVEVHAAWKRHAKYLAINRPRC